MTYTPCCLLCLFPIYTPHTPHTPCLFCSVFFPISFPFCHRSSCLQRNPEYRLAPAWRPRKRFHSFTFTTRPWSRPTTTREMMNRLLTLAWIMTFIYIALLGYHARDDYIPSRLIRTFIHSFIQDLGVGFSLGFVGL